MIFIDRDFREEGRKPESRLFSSQGGHAKRRIRKKKPNGIAKILPKGR